MNLPEPLLSCFHEAEQLVAVAETAARHRKPINGHGPYAVRFHDAVIKLAIAEKNLVEFLTKQAADYLAKAQSLLATIKGLTIKISDRKSALKEFDFLLRAEVATRIADLDEPSKPTSEPVFALSLFKNAPQYLQRIALQANGCFNERWFDASGVMIRRVVESLIIEVYERNNQSAEVKSGDQYLMLADLVKKFGVQNRWALNRETQKTLPLLKTLGDRSAHTRYYSTQRPDIEKVIPGLRVTVDNLLQHAGYAP